MLTQYYLSKLGIKNIPSFLQKYLECPSIKRLQKVGYFCGMDYASKHIYQFSEYITRYDHSLSVALLTYKFTKDKKATIAGLIHDIATPCFSHVIDYMNEDYESQESTEEYTETIIKEDKYLMNCLKEDNIHVDEITNFKNYSVVDNERPKLCADRVDGVILTGLGWTKNITKEDIDNIVDDLTLFTNDDNELELGFTKESVVKKVVEVSKSIDIYCHSKEDNYMMQLLAQITKLAITNKYITYDDLYKLNEDEIFKIFNRKRNIELKNLLNKFKTITLDEIPDIELPKVKIRKLNPLLNNIRYK
jgi:HD superfamily phosphohydrolase